MSLRATMLTLVAVLFAGFTSCSKSDDSSTPSETTSSVPVSGVMECEFTPSEDELTVFGFTAEYTDESGQTKTEEIAGKWSKRVTFKSLPAKASLTITRSLKPNVELTKDKYTFGTSVSTSIYALKADGTKAGVGQAPSSGSLKETMAKDKVELHKEIKMKKPVVFSFSYTISNKANAEGEYVY